MNKFKLSEDGIKLLTTLEGIKLKTYRCGANTPTIGIGHTKDVKDGMVITQQQAISFLKEDLLSFESAINKLVTVSLNQNQYDSLVLFIFNIGITAFANSTLLKLLNKKDYKGAADQFLRWNKINGKESAGLTKRRNVERMLFLS